MIRRPETDADYAGFAAVWNAITPREPIEGSKLRERLARQPQRLYLVAECDRGVAGCAMAAPSDAPGRAFLAVRVLPAWRARGIGSRLHELVAAHARAWDVASFSGHVREDDSAGRTFAERRGYREVSRQVELVRELRGDERPSPPPPGIEIVELTESMRRGAYAVAQEAWPDLPLPERLDAPSYDDWEWEELDGPVAFAAVEAGRVVGYAALLAKARPDLLEHGLTACLRTHRGRGIGTALKRAQIAWAAANGYRELITFTQDGNAAMQAVNRKLGYVAQPAWLTMRREVASDRGLRRPALAGTVSGEVPASQ